MFVEMDDAVVKERNKNTLCSCMCEALSSLIPHTAKNDSMLLQRRRKQSNKFAIETRHMLMMSRFWATS
jgi:hypothetical protein